MGKVDNVMTGSEDSSNYNKHPYNNKNNNGDHPIFPPGGSLDNGGVFVPPMAATLAPTHLPGSYNPVDKEQATQLVRYFHLPTPP